MAITGTGTQADPYVVTTWDELLSVSDTDGVYIDLPDNAVYDMNDFYPEGIAETIQLRGFINGNGATIKNAAYRGGACAFKMSGNSNYGSIKNLNFANFRLQATYTGASLLGTDNGEYSGRAFELCRFSGRIEVLSGDYCAISRGGYQAEHYRCSYNIEAIGQTSIDTGNYGAISRYCRIEINNVGGQYPFYVSPDNSYITGHVGSLYMIRVDSRGAYESVMDATVETRIGMETGTPIKVLVNTDKYSGTLPSGYLGCTTAQLRDAAYLHSIGFPVQT